MATFASAASPPAADDVDGWISYLVEGERPFGSDRVPFDEADARALATLVVERTRDLESMLTNHPIAPQGEPWRARLYGVTVPVAVIHGEDDPLFPVANAEALASELASATLHVVAGMGHEMPSRVRPTVAGLIVDAVRSGEAARRSAPSTR